MLSSETDRMSWDEYFSTMAELASKRSPCERLHVGCVLVRENRIISMGYNGFLPGAPHISRIRDNHEMGTVHAEQNAICDAAKRGVSIKDTTAYITHFPCINCFKMLVASGCQRIVYNNDYKNDELVYKLAEESSVILFSKY